jgi:orotate phosphoribosyltransferase
MNSLIEALKEINAIKFGDFILASGKKSSYYIDIKKASTDPHLLKQMARQISEILRLNAIQADYIGGVALGGVPIAVAASLETNIPLIIIRKEIKEYGTKGQIMGEFEPGKTVVLVEDVTTTGVSVLNGIKTLRAKGLVAHHVITVVDREEGASLALVSEDIKLIPLIRVRELLSK